MKGDKRQKVLETVQEFKAGITIQELITLLVDDFRGAQEPERAVSQTLWRLSSAGLIERKNGKYYPVNGSIAPGDAARAPGQQPQGLRVELSAIQKERDTQTVVLYQSPVEIENVVMVQLNIDGHWVRIPLFGDLRICVGASIPRWSHNQEVNRGVRIIRLVQKNGQVVDTPVDPANPITIAPLDE